MPILNDEILQILDDSSDAGGIKEFTLLLKA